jgi:hypothetical protein
VGLTPTGKRRLFTAHANSGSSQLRYTSFKTDGGYGLSPVRGPPLWEYFDAQVEEVAQFEPDGDLAAQPAPDYVMDQRVQC